jgi:predicted small lipoprotein YifL
MWPRNYWVLLLLILSLAGCGYRPLGAGPPTAKAPPTLAIPPFANRSVEVGLEAIFAEALIHAFSQTRAVRVTTRPQDADLVLEGQVRAVDFSSVAYLSITRSNVRRVTLHVELDLRQKASGKVLWKDTMVLTEDYVVDINYHIGEATKNEGIRRAANTMAKRVLDKILLVI